MAKKTLLLVFIHGFKVLCPPSHPPHPTYPSTQSPHCLPRRDDQPSLASRPRNTTNQQQGDDNTFASFPEHLASLLSHDVPSSTQVVAKRYPAFETRGELPSAVTAFRDWLQNAVIDLEVSAGTASPTVAPSVHVVLCGHSMGGIVAADTLLSIASDTAVGVGSSNSDGDTIGGGGGNIGQLFPDIRGVLAFDTPYLGIAPSVLAHGAETHYQTASTVISQLQQFGVLGTGSSSSQSANAATNASASALGGKTPLALPAPDVSGAGWQRWGKMAMYAGAAAAVAGASAMAYKNKDAITEGVGWATSHLEFVGCLMRPEDLRRRVARIESLSTSTEMVRRDAEESKDPRLRMMAQTELKREEGTAGEGGGRVGWMNLYTRLGRSASSQQQSVAGTLTGTSTSGRTFCNLPKSELTRHWREEVNDKATDEVGAHMEMFNPGMNPGYERLKEHARDYIVSWTKEVLSEGFEEVGRIEY